MKVANYQLDELLEQVNSAENVEEALTGILKIPYVKNYLDLNVNDVHLDFDIPEFTPTDYHRSMSGAYLLSRSSAIVLNEVILNNTVLMKNRKFQLKSLLEMLYSGESKLLQAILTKNLTSLYPNITHELICKFYESQRN